MIDRFYDLETLHFGYAQCSIKDETLKPCTSAALSARLRIEL